MNSVCFVQSNVDSLPPPNAVVASLAELPAQISSGVLSSPRSLPRNEPTTNRPRRITLARHSKKTETWLADALLSRWKGYRERLDECRNKPTAESVHELRVTIRRLLSQLALVNQIFPVRKSEKVRKILKYQLEALGNLRDTQVQQLLFRQQVTKFPHLTDLLLRLKRRENALVKRASRTILRFKTKKVESWVRNISKLLQYQFDSPHVRREIVGIALQSANVAFAEVVGRWRLINRSDVRTIHRTRVAFKRFRYIVEVLPPELSGLSKRELRVLAWYQRKMGNIQDLEVIQACVNEFVQRHEAAGSLLKPFCTYLRRRRSRALWSFRKSADELFSFWRLPGHLDKGIAGCPRSTASFAL